MNANFVQNYISAIHFGDLAKRGRPWLKVDMVNGKPTMEDAPVNSLGYPLEPAASSVLLQNYQVPLRTGANNNDLIVLTYNEGTAGSSIQPSIVGLVGLNVNFDHMIPADASGTVRKYYTLGVDAAGTLLYNANVDIMVFQVNSNDVAMNGGNDLDLQLHLWVDETHEAAQLANPKEVFHDQYLTRMNELAPSHVRTGPNWSRNNTAGSALGGWKPDWSTRRLPTTSRWAQPQEVPWEVHCWLANKLQTDLWVSIPLITFDPQAGNGDPDYERAKTYTKELAKLIMAELDPDRHCIVEWSNEIWNPSFTTYNWLVSLVGSPTPTVQELADKAAEINLLVFTWWSEEWNDCRVEYAAMGQAGDTTWSQTIGSALAPWNMVDAVGCTIYMLPDATVSDPWLTGVEPLPNDDIGWAKIEQALIDSTDNDNDAFDSGMNEEAGDGNTSFIRGHGEVADLVRTLRPDNRSVDLYVYEAGPSLIVPKSSTASNAEGVRTTYTGVQNTTYMNTALTHMLNRLLLPYDSVTNMVGVQPALPHLPKRFGYFTFAQVKDSTFGSYYALEDLYTGIVLNVGKIHPEAQLKFKALLDFIAAL